MKEKKGIKESISKQEEMFWQVCVIGGAFS